MTRYEVLAPRMQSLEDVPEPYVLTRRGPTTGVATGSLAAGMYVLSFFLPVADHLPGWHAFIMALLFVITIPMWLANVAFWRGLYYLSSGNYKSASKAGTIGFFLAISESWMFFGYGLGVGYFVWVGSMAALAAVGLCRGEEGRPQSWWPRSEWLGNGEAARIAARFRR